MRLDLYKNIKKSIAFGGTFFDEFKLGLHQEFRGSICCILKIHLL